MNLKKIGLIAFSLFLLIVVQVALMYLKKEISLIPILEVGSMVLIIIIYYSVVSTEISIAAKKLEERLMKVEKYFEIVENKFTDEVKILGKEVNELKTLLKEDSKLHHKI